MQRYIFVSNTCYFFYIVFFVFYCFLLCFSVIRQFVISVDFFYHFDEF